MVDTDSLSGIPRRQLQHEGRQVHGHDRSVFHPFRARGGTGWGAAIRSNEGGMYLILILPQNVASSALKRPALRAW